MKLIIFIFFLSLQLFSTETYKVGFSQDTLGNDWRLAQVNEVKKEISKYPFLKFTLKDANAKVANQIADLEYFIDNNYDFIITSPINASITSLVLKKAIKKGINVILIDRGITSNDYTTFISADNRRIATEAAKFMSEKLEGKGTILMLEGVKSATPTLHRTEGFESIMKNYPNIKIIKRTGNFLRADAMKIMEEIYSYDIKFDAIYSHSDSMLSGVREVLKKYNKKDDFLMVGIDYIMEAKEAISKNRQTASFTYPTCGKEGVQAIIDIINKKEIIRNKVIESTIITKENVKDIEPIF